MGDMISKISNVLILGGVVIVGYYYYKCAKEVGSYEPLKVLGCGLKNTGSDLGKLPFEFAKGVGEGIKDGLISMGVPEEVFPGEGTE